MQLHRFVFADMGDKADGLVSLQGGSHVVVKSGGEAAALVGGMNVGFEEITAVFYGRFAIIPVRNQRAFFFNYNAVENVVGVAILIPMSPDFNRTGIVGLDGVAELNDCLVFRIGGGERPYFYHS